MLKEDIINISKARINHAEECLREAELLLSTDEYKGAANRAYYAAFHSLRAVLILDEFDSKKHSGIIAKFGEKYLKAGIFDKQISEYISSLFRIRTASDYDDFYIISKDEAKSQLEKAKEIVGKIELYLSKQY